MEARARSKVAICDQSPKIGPLIQNILGDLYECVVLSSAEELFDYCSREPPDVILTEVNLPGVDGLELCRRVRSNPRLCGVPLVVVTSVVNDDTRAQSLEYGADDYLFKPIRPRELRARVVSLLKLRAAQVALEARTLELEAANRFLTQTQNALVQAEKLASIGTLVAGVAHELNNPLAFIKSGGNSLADYLKDLEEQVAKAVDSPEQSQRQDARGHVTEMLGECRAILADVADGTLRLQRICSDLKVIAADKKPALEPVDLELEVGRAWKMASPPAAVELICDLSPIEPIESVGHMVGQVLLNLFINACHAMGGAGKIWCTISESDGEVLISVKDSGPGISPVHLARIFDPFFTTKPPGKGTGLGLAVSQAMVRKLGGSLEATSPVGQGATFTLRLPRDLTEQYTGLRSSGALAP